MRERVVYYLCACERSGKRMTAVVCGAFALMTSAQCSFYGAFFSFFHFLECPRVIRNCVVVRNIRFIKIT